MMTARPCFTRCQPRTRRGGVYIAVLGATMIVAMIGLCSLHVARVELRGAQHRTQLNQARCLAQSGIEFALANIEFNSNWRTSYFSGVESAPVTLANGKVYCKLVDPVDGNLANKTTDPVVMYGIGRVKGTTFVYQAQYQIGPEGSFQLIPGSWQQSTL